MWFILTVAIALVAGWILYNLWIPRWSWAVTTQGLDLGRSQRLALRMMRMEWRRLSKVPDRRCMPLLRAMATYVSLGEDEEWAERLREPGWLQDSMTRFMEIANAAADPKHPAAREIDSIMKYSPPPAPQSGTPEACRDRLVDTMRTYGNSFGSKPICGLEARQAALRDLDADVAEELEKAALEEDAMWRELKAKCGVESPKTREQYAFRDEAVRRSGVRMFRAMDEQLRRRGLPPSRKPEAWTTHHDGGNIGLSPASWQRA